MDATATRRLALTRTRWTGFSRPAVAWLAGFAPLVYLGLEGGGYGIVGRSQVGIALWWILAVGVVTGAITVRGLTRAVWVPTIAFTGLAVWIAVSLSWTESQEHTMAEVGRASTYLAFFLIACIGARAGFTRWMVGGIASGVVIVAALGVASRTLPGTLEVSAAAAAVTQMTTRLSYPITYWNGLGALCVMGVPLLLHFATTSRSVALRSLAAACIPVLALCAFLTASRASAYEAVVALGAYLLLAPDRLHRLATAVPAVCASLLVSLAADQRPAVTEGLQSSAAVSQGRELLFILLIVVAATGLLQAAIALAAEHLRSPDRRRVPTPARRAIWAGGVVAAVIAMAAAGAPGRVSDAWESFKQPPNLENTVTGSSLLERLGSSNGIGRYQLWQSAIDAAESKPLTGRGAGSFEFWWAREGTIPLFVRNAHSLYLETAADLGWIGLALLIAFLASAVAFAGMRLLRARDLATRDTVAAAAASCAVFLTAAALDWVWQLAAVAAVFLMLAGVLVSSGRDAETAEPAPPSGVPKVAAVMACLIAAAAIVPSLAGESAVLRSQAEARQSNFDGALSQAGAALSVQPYSASSKLQRAVLLEKTGDLAGAARSALAATVSEPTNWRTWFVLSRLEAARGRTVAALSAYDRARALNPRSPLFKEGPNGT